MNLFEDININTVVEQLSSEQSEMLKQEKAPKCAVLKAKQKHKHLYVYRTWYLTQESIDKIHLLK